MLGIKRNTGKGKGAGGAGESSGPGYFYLSTVSKVLGWAQANSLWYLGTGAGCCADELFQAFGARYDLERFGCRPRAEAGQADLLIVSGAVSYMAAPYLRELYDQMLEPKYVMALGACACGGGAFAPELSYSVVPGVDRVLPVDVYVPGCPPRPESIMNGLIALQERIRG
jgi:NADH-quinone oxidoreductase subunit B